MTRAPTSAPKPRDAAEAHIDTLLRAQVRALPTGQKFPVFVRDEVVAAHYGVPVNTFVLLSQDEALYMLEGRWAFSVQGPLISPGNYQAHPIAEPFVPFGTAPPPEPSPPPPPAARGSKAGK